MTRWRWILARIVRRIWFRAMLISLAGVLLALLAAVAPAYLPYRLSGDLGQDAVGNILQIMASSMLAVTTFSLTAMVSAYGSATQLATPRATQLMISDPTSQNALSTFLGAFVFAIVGIVALSTSAYGDQGRIILFVGTVVVIAAVVMTLLRWITHITGFGRMADVIDRVERAATEAMRDFTQAPHHGGRPAIAIPADAASLASEATGYVTFLDVDALGRVADQAGLTLHVTALPGTLVHPARTLLRIEGQTDAAIRKRLRAAFTIERHRSFDQDPRLGLIALSEIASRALAPATNDPGTGIEVLNALLRVLLHLPADEPDGEAVRARPAVYVPRPAIATMLTDAFRPILREGCGEVEVAIRLTKTLAALHDGLPHAAAPLRAMAERVAARIERTLEDPADAADYARVHERLWPARG